MWTKMSLFAAISARCCHWNDKIWYAMLLYLGDKILSALSMSHIILNVNINEIVSISVRCYCWNDKNGISCCFALVVRILLSLFSVTNFIVECEPKWACLLPFQQDVVIEMTRYDMRCYTLLGWWNPFPFFNVTYILWLNVKGTLTDVE